MVAGKLDFSPPVVDLAAAGYPLAGGRLEHFAGQSAAALVFRRRAHAINVFIWPDTREAVTPRATELNGFHVQSYPKAGSTFWPCPKSRRRSSVNSPRPSNPRMPIKSGDCVGDQVPPAQRGFWRKW